MSQCIENYGVPFIGVLNVFHLPISDTHKQSCKTFLKKSESQKLYLRIWQSCDLSFILYFKWQFYIIFQLQYFVSTLYLTWSRVATCTVGTVNPTEAWMGQVCMELSDLNFSQLAVSPLTMVTVWMLSDVFHVLFPLSPFPLPSGRYSMALLYCFFSSDIPLWPLEPHYNVTSSALLWALTCGVCPGFDKVLYFPSLYYQC